MADALRLTRLQRGLSQSDIAQLIGISRSSIAQMEMARFNAKITTLDRYATALGLELRIELV